ncbi:hypothetical protein [Streptomyces sp. NPDC054975]
MFRDRMVRAASVLVVATAALVAPAAVAQADTPVPPAGSGVSAGPVEPVSDGTDDMGWQ